MVQVDDERLKLLLGSPDKSRHRSWITRRLDPGQVKQIDNCLQGIANRHIHRDNSDALSLGSSRLRSHYRQKFVTAALPHTMADRKLREIKRHGTPRDPQIPHLTERNVEICA